MILKISRQKKGLIFYASKKGIFFQCASGRVNQDVTYLKVRITENKLEYV